MLGNRIKQMRKLKGWSQKKLAEAMEISRSTVAMWEVGANDMTLPTLAKLADALETSQEYLLGMTDDPAPLGAVEYTDADGAAWEAADADARAYHQRRAARVPVYGVIPAGIPMEAIEDIEDWEEIPTDWLRGGKEYFCLRIRGNSMEPMLLPGDVVIVRAQNTAESGDIAVVLVGGDEATCKKIQKTPEGIILLSLNPSYQPMFYTNEMIESLPLIIFGKVVEMRRSL
jgi:repressor LexA